MCDDGMLDHRRIHEHRVLTSLVSNEATTREAALAKATTLLIDAPAESTAVVLSAEHSLEDNFALLEFARDVLGTSQLFFTGRPPGEGDQVLRDPDKNPNTAGVKKLAPQAKSFAEFAKAAVDGKFTHAVVLGSQTPVDAVAALAAIKHVIALPTHEGPIASGAKVVLPASSWAEANGTFVNRQGFSQESERAITPRGDSRPAYRWILDLARALDKPPAWYKFDELRAAMQPRPTASVAPAGGAS